MAKATLPDWNYWRHYPSVEIWQACALSLNLDPDKFDWSPDRWMLGSGDYPPHVTADSFRDASEEEAFHKRVKLLVANILKRQHFSAEIINIVKRYKSRVRLPELGAWALTVGWSFPDEFPMPAAAAIGPSAQSQASGGSKVTAPSKPELPNEPAEKRAWLLREFRRLEGKRPSEGKKGKWGALASLSRTTGIDDKNLGKMLDKAIEESIHAALWASLNPK